MRRIPRVFLLAVTFLSLIMNAANGQTDPVEPCPFQVNLGPDTLICDGTSVMLDAEIPGAAYYWSDWSTSPQIFVFFGGEYTVTVTKDGCEVKDTIYVGLKPSLYADFNHAPVSDSTPGKITFTDMSTSCDGTVTEWTWNFGDGQTSSEQSPTHNYTEPGDYDVMLTIKDNFGSMQPVLMGVSVAAVTDTTAAEPDSDPQLEPEPEPEPEQDPGPLPEPDPVPDPQPDPPSEPDTVVNTCYGVQKPEITQNENILKTGNATSYKWYREATLISGAGQKTIRVNQQGYYTVKVLNSEGCESESDPFFFMPVAAEEKNEEIRVKCSPNPGHGTINILLSEIPEKPAKLTIYNLFGSQLFSTYVKDNVTPLNGIKLSKGMYMVEILINGKRKTVTAIVQ
jgi:hypothetical protein